MERETLVKIGTLVRQAVQKEMSKRLRVELDADMEGMCLACSSLLYLVLDKMEMQPTLCYGKYESRWHTWVETKQYEIIDLTLTQFRSAAEVSILPYARAQQYEVTENWHNIKKFVEECDKTQVPLWSFFERMVKKILKHVGE